MGFIWQSAICHEEEPASPTKPSRGGGKKGKAEFRLLIPADMKRRIHDDHIVALREPFRHIMPMEHGAAGECA